MAKRRKQPVTIIGAGLTGCFLSMLLAKRGFKVNIFEKLHENPKGPINKSYSLTFYGYATRALKMAGIWKKVKKILVRLDGSQTYLSKSPGPVFAKFGKGIPYYAVSRGSLLECFRQIARSMANIRFHYESALIFIDRKDKSIFIQNTLSKKIRRYSSSVIFGADGVSSTVRQFIQKGQQSSQIQEYSDWFYKQVSLSKSTVQKLKLKKGFTYSWTSDRLILVSYPDPGKTFSGILLSKQKENKLSSVKEIFPDLYPAFDDIAGSLFENPQSSFVTLNTSPWHYRDFMVILGDAAHAFYPFFGQGISVGFGDCLSLIALIKKYPGSWSKIFEAFQLSRKKNTDIIAFLSKNAFERYKRNKKADFSAIYEKFEEIIHRLFPGIFAPPLFDLIALNPVNAADAFKNWQKQRKVFQLLGIPLLISFAVLILGKIEDWNYRLGKNRLARS